MKRIAFLIIIAVAVGVASGCKKDKTPKTADLMVACKALEGYDVDVSDLKAELHATATYDNLKYSFPVTGTLQSSTGSIKDIAPGRYFLVVWKDNDANQTFSKTDFFGFYPYALDLKGGDKKSLTVEMYIVD
ncbi:MAG: hypothetical protein R6V49_04805 [Bacteroidales bacterium]